MIGWLRHHLVLILGLVVLVYTFVPIAVIIAMSFNIPPSRNVYAFDRSRSTTGRNPCLDPSMCSALGRSIEIGLLATLGATVLGTLAAFALVRHDFVGRSSTNLLIFLPMAAPEIVMGSSLLALFVAAGFAGQLGFWTILDRPHHVLPVVRRGDRAGPARRAWTTTSNRPRWTSTPPRRRRSGG